MAGSASESLSLQVETVIHSKLQGKLVLIRYWRPLSGSKSRVKNNLGHFNKSPQIVRSQ